MCYRRPRLRSDMFGYLNYLVLAAFFVLTLSAGVRAEQYFIEEPSDITSKLGDEVIFKCVVGDQEGGIQWTRNKFGLGTNPALPGFPRYTLTRDNFLKISPVTEDDVGEYQCQVGAGENSMPIRSRSAKLAVQLPPGKPEILGADSSGRISVSEGATGFLECMVDGAKPAATIDWSGENGTPLKLDSKDSRTIKSDDTQTFRTQSSVRFHVDRSMQNKVVTCIAENIASRKPNTTSVRLNVLYKPKVTLGMNLGSGSVTEGDTVVLHCVVDSNPAPHGISWWKNGKVMPGENSEHLTLSGIGSSFNGAVVECEARNSLGSATASTTLKLTYAPRIISHPKSVAKKEGDRVELRCEADSNPPARYVWYNLERPDEPIEYSDTLQLIVSHHTVGRYKCRALVDGFPLADSSVATVSRLEAPKILATAETQKAAVGGDVEIVCSVDTMVMENLNITWYYRGRVLIEGGKYVMSTSQRTGGVEAILYVRDVTAAADFGEYGCRVDNEIGSDYASISLEQASSGPLEIIMDYLPYIACMGVGVILVLAIITVVYCCRRGRKSGRRSAGRSTTHSEIEEGNYLVDDLAKHRNIIKNNSSNALRGMGDGSYRGSIIANDILERVETASMNSQADSLARLMPRPLQNLPQNVAGYYGNAMLNSRMEDDRMSSSSGSQSHYPMMGPGGQENWGRPPSMLAGGLGGRRRSNSPYTTGSELMDFSGNSTMSSVMSKGSRTSRSQPESAQSSGEETPLMSRRSLAEQIQRGGTGHNSRYYAGGGGGSHSDGEEMSRRGKPGFGGGYSGSDSEDGGGGGRRGNTSSGYYSDGGTSRSGRSLGRMRRVSEEENHDARDDELHTLSE